MKTAVLVASMGGPDSLNTVRPFLFNLFKDKAILRMPAVFRYPLALLISFLRADAAKKNYDLIGGASPIVANTRAQAEELELVCARSDDVRCFVGMSYWHPMISEAVEKIKEWKPDQIIILPMYPQYSTTTTASVIEDALRAMKKCGITAPALEIDQFFTETGFIEAVTALLRPVYEMAQHYGKPRVLFSAHGLPESIVRAGDPYPEQCQKTVSAILEKWAVEDSDYSLCYQSKVGRMRWIGPSTEDEIVAASKDKRPIIVVPIAFVCEHSETLVELCIEYRDLALKHGAPFYEVIKTVGTHPAFIDGLARLVLEINQNGKKNAVIRK